MAFALEADAADAADSTVRLRALAGAPRVAVAPTKYETAWPRGPRHDRENPRSSYERLDLEEALTRVYTSDAHLVTYVVETSATHQPRLAKASLADYPIATTTQVLCCDVDNPEHAPTTREMLYAHPPLETEGIYWTRAGYRLVQPLAAPVPTREAEAVLYAWLLRLEARGVPLDWSCRDWTRHFRLPNVRREKHGDYRSPRIDLSRMEAITIAPVAIPERVHPRPRRRPLTPHAPPPVYSAEPLPASWAALAGELAAVARVKAGERHRFGLALGGALLHCGVPEEIVPAMVRTVAALTGATAPQHHEINARRTVERRRQGIAVTGLPALWDGWGSVANLLTHATAPAPSLAPVDMPRVFVEAGDGLTILAAECGAGKTHAAEALACARSRTAHRGRTPPRTPRTKGSP